MNFKTLKSFDNAIEAHILKNRLEAEEVECLILDENIVTLNPLFNFAVGGIRLQVREADFEKAKAILLEIDNKPYTNSENEVISCPNCNSTSIISDYKSMKSVKGIIAFIIGLILSTFPIYTKSVFKCKDCRMEFEPKK